MSKKLGLAFMFIGAYLMLLGGLFFLMHFYGAGFPEKPKDYEWVWGVLTALVMIGGSVLACKKYFLGLLGFIVDLIGIGLSVWVMVYSINDWNYLSPFFLIGIILSTLGCVIGVIFHIINTQKARKYGESLL